MNIRYLLVILAISASMASTAQVSFFSKNKVKPILSESDSVLLESLPELKLPESLKLRDLPAVHDNSESPYLRPVFDQNGANCGQASGVAYNFTYELNRLRNLSSKDSVNQYPSHFTWNFQNGGNGYFGVSYLQSFEILKAVGNPNVPVYGAWDTTNGVRWMSGYDKYFSSMHNRVRGVSQIVVNTDEGLLTLKHWLNNHLEGSENGGVASFYAASPYGYQTLPDDSPEAGKHVMAEFGGPSATHAMTIVGYHDSICFDYNDDGQYTNDLDINEDGIIDMRDREIGGLKFVNSYGDDWADSGFCYMMYKTLADKLGEGGIWNHCVHVLDVKEAYDPKLSLKFTLKHDSRGKLKVTAGVARDTSVLMPEHVMHFPIFNYQGGHHYMQGGRLNEIDKFLETGLDITPLLGYLEAGQPAKFFIQVTETDPLNEGTGRLLGVSLMDYNNGLVEIPCQEQDVALTEDGITRLSIVHTPDFDKVEISTDELPVVTGSGNYQVQLDAQGGQEPYQWQLGTLWHEQRYDFDMPEIDDEMLYPEEPNQHFTGKKIDFEFPFYGEKYDSVFVHESGFLMFAPDLYPWPYFNDPYILFKKVKNISAFHFSPVKYYNDPLRDDPEIWYEGNEYFAAFRWTGPLFYFNQHVGEGEYALVLYPDGNVDFYYDSIQLDEEVVWYAGVSAGNEADYSLLKKSNSIVTPEISSYRLIPEERPEGLEITENGILSGNIEPSENISNILVTVKDDRGIIDSRIFRLSDGLIYSYEINAGPDGMIENGETFTIDLTVKNIFDDPFHNVIGSLSGDDTHLLMISSVATFGDINPGESVTVEGAFTLKVLDGCPDQYDFLSDLSLTCDEADWSGKISFESFAASMHINSLAVQDDNNNRIDPGETVDVAVRVLNSGFLEVGNAEVTLEVDNELISITEPTLSYGTLNPGEEKTMFFQVSAAGDIPIGDVVSFEVVLNFNDNNQITKTFQITIGQYTALIFRKGSNPASAEALLETMEDLGVAAIYTTILPEEFAMYRSVFICLGGFLESNALSQEEASLLVSYLNQNGRLYLEGTMTWTFDPQTSLHPKFKAGAEQVSFTPFDQLAGVSGTFTEGMNFTFSGANNMLPCLMHPEEPAYSVFYADGDEEQAVATANPAWNYKTIGMVNEFSTLGDESNADDRRDFLYAVLDFFDLEDYVVGVPGISPTPQVIPEVGAFPNPFKSEATIYVELDETAKIDIDIYDLSGQHVRKLTSEIYNRGKHQILWSGHDRFGRQMPPGIYIYQVRAGAYMHTGKLIRMK